MLQAWAPVVPNVCALNSMGLREMGLGRETPDRVSNVWVEKDAAGEPTGRLRGSVTNYYTGDEFMDGLLRRLPRGTLDDLLGGTRDAMRRYNELGVTMVYEGHTMSAALVGAYRKLRRQDAMTVRALWATEAESYVWSTDRELSMSEYHERLEEALAMHDTSDAMLRTNGITVERGGPCWPGFLRMRDPYKGPYGELTRGRAFVEQEKIEMAIDFCGRTGLRLNAICTGTAEHDEFLDMCEAAAHKCDLASRHWILQHVFFLESQQAHRYARLGFDVTTSISFSWGKGDMFRERIGEHVLEHLIPLRRMLDAGMTVACGSDWGPKNIFEQIQLAQTHRFCGSGRSNRGVAQGVSAEEAVAMWTREAGRVLQWKGTGTLTPGDCADLIVVDRNPLQCATEDIAATRVLRTVLDGNTVFDSGAL